jgi:mannose-1-phosphate guanylyltransferase
VREIIGRDPDCTIALFPSDHHYRENSIFQATIDRALQFAKVCGDRLLIIGAPATYPEVEYGWIQPRPIVLQSRLNALQYVSRFWEKPNLVQARALQKSGCLWNTFVMVGSGKALLGLLGATVPYLLAAIGTGFPHPISIGSIAKSNRLTSRKTSYQRLQSVSSCCAMGLLVGRISAAHEEPWTCSILSLLFSRLSAVGDRTIAI